MTLDGYRELEAKVAALEAENSTLRGHIEQLREAVEEGLSTYKVPMTARICEAITALLGLPIAVWNGAMDIIAKTLETGGNIADAIKRGLNYNQKNHRGQWNKKQFNDEVMKELGVRGITVNAEDLVVKDVDKEFAETINGFYSDLEQTILEVSPTDKGTPQAWLKKIGTGDEAKWTGVTDWLNSLPKDQNVTRKEILDWLKDNRIQVVEVVKGDKLKEYERLRNNAERT